MYQYTEFDKQFVRSRAAQYRDQLERNLAGTLGISLLGAYQASLLAGGVAALQSSPAAGQLTPQAAAMLRDPTSLGRALTTPSIAAQLPPDLVAALRAAADGVPAAS